jgi:hypothetical protein
MNNPSLYAGNAGGKSLSNLQGKSLVPGVQKLKLISEEFMYNGKHLYIQQV